MNIGGKLVGPEHITLDKKCSPGRKDLTAIVRQHVTNIEAGTKPSLLHLRRQTVSLTFDTALGTSPSRPCPHLPSAPALPSPYICVCF